MSDESIINLVEKHLSLIDRPDLLAELAPGQDVEPGEILIKSNVELCWQCHFGHVWRAILRNRALKGVGCPYCSGRLAIPGVNDLAFRRPDLAAEFDPDLNGDLAPRDLKEYSAKKVWWRCQKGHPAWLAIVANRSKGQGCPYCSGRKPIPGETDLQSRNPDLAAEWDYEANAPFEPSEVAVSTPKKVGWICPLEHKYQASPNNRNKGSGCPFCANQAVLAKWNDLASQAPDLAKEYSSRNEKTADQVYVYAKYKVEWNCLQGHQPWKAVVRNRTKLGSGCPVCIGRFQPGVTSIDVLGKDFVKEWHPSRNLPLTPRDVGMGEKVWWLCPAGHEYRNSGRNRRTTDSRSGSNCPECAQSGYSSGKTGIFYLLRHSELFARKAGITNDGIKTDRLAMWVGLGWTVEKVWKGEGHTIRDLETDFFRWIRNDLGLPPAIGIEEMGRAGWKETFSLDGPELAEILGKVGEIYNRLQATEAEKVPQSG